MNQQETDSGMDLSGIRHMLPVCFAVAALMLAAFVPAASAGGGVWRGFNPPSDTFPGSSVTENVPVRMKDGVILLANVTRPATAEGAPIEGRFPVVVEQTCYKKGVFTGPGKTADYARHGYVHVMVSVRGTGGSGGSFNVLDQTERMDGRRLVGWAARQSWSNGKVGVTGFSYMGASANRTAETNPPALKAAFVGGSPSDIYREFMAEGGVWSKGSSMWNTLANSGSDPAGTFREGAFLGMESGVFNWDLDMWRQRDVDVTNYKAPTMVYTGWEDIFFRSSPRQYRAMKLAPGRKQLVIGPWTHYSFPKSVGPGGAFDMTDMEMAWFDRWLKGKRNGITNLGPVTLFDQGVDKWKRYSSWPAKRVKFRRFYLNSKKSGSAVSLNDGSLVAGKEAGSRGADGGLDDPTAGACSRSLSQYTAGAIPATTPCNLDQRSEEDTALTYTTRPLPKRLHLNGALALTLHGKSTASDPLWVARISDVTPDGTSVPITQGSLLASRRELDRKRTVFAPNGDPVEPFHKHTKRSSKAPRPGTAHKLNIEILATDWVIRPGHRLRLTIAGADTGHFVPSATTPEQSGESTVLTGPGRQSFLTIGTTP